MSNDKVDIVKWVTNNDKELGEKLKEYDNPVAVVLGSLRKCISPTVEEILNGAEG